MAVQRRKRSAYAHQPRISNDMHSVVETAVIVCEHLRCCCQARPRDIVDDLLLPSLRKGMERSLSSHLAHTAAEWLTAREHVARLGLEVNDRYSHHDCCGQVASYDEVYTQVLARLSSVESQEAIAVDAAVAALNRDGYDGEEIASEVIIRETNLHLGLLHKEISKLKGNLPETTSEDLLGFAWRGLRVALRQFDPGLGYSFSTYACPKINGAIRDGVRSESHLPKRLTTLVRKVNNANEELTQKLARTPSLQDICEYLDAPYPSLLPRLSAPASLDELAEALDGDYTPGALIDESDPVEAAHTSLRGQAIEENLATLDPLAREIMLGLFYHDKTLTALSSELGIDVRTARSIRDNSLATLRDELAAWA